MDVNLDINVVGVFALLLGAFGFYVRLTIKSAIADLKDALTKIYMSGAETTARFAAMQGKIESLEKLITDHIHLFHGGKE
jgi:hypothetical protein